MNKLEKLEKISLFSEFATNREKLQKFYEIMKTEIFKAKQKIIEEGTLGNKLYILYKGSVRILRKTLTNDQYTVVILNADDHIFFGEVALIDSDRRSATVVAETDCEVLSVDRSKFLKFCEENPLMGYKITLNIAKRISASLRKMNQDVITLFEALVGEVEGVV